MEIQNTVSRRTILRLLGGCAGPALVSACSRSDTLDEDTFRQTVIALLGHRHPDWHVVPGAHPQTIVIGNAEIYLDNIYRHVRKLPPAQRDDEIVTLIEKGLARRETSNEDPGFAAASDRVRPQIVPADYLQEVGGLVHRQFLAGLVVAYAIDEKERYKLLQQPLIDSWHIGQPEIETRAIANLEAVSAGTPLSPRSNAEGGAVRRRTHFGRLRRGTAVVAAAYAACSSDPEHIARFCLHSQPRLPCRLDT